jgi:carbon-monoxide dehydrogenase medium subunit
MFTIRPESFDYHRPGTLEEAIALLQTTDGSHALAGGHSLVPAMKLRIANPSALIDISRIPGLADIEENSNGLSVGAMTTHETVAGSEVVKAGWSLLAETAGQIGDPQVRARGTIGGSIAHADPAADYPTALLALGATIHTTGPEGARQIAAGDFFVDIFETALQDGELVTKVTVPPIAPGTGSTYLKFNHPASDYAVVGVAASVTLEAGVCSDVRLAVGGVVGRPILVDAVSEALQGSAPSTETIAAAADTVAAALTKPIGDLFASGEYRVHLATVYTRRALAQAARGAAG